MKPPRLIPNSPDIMEQIQYHLDLIWEAIENAKGVGGKTIRLLGPLDMMGLPIQGIAPMTPAHHSGTHQYGGADEVDVTNLSGVLLDPQTPKLMASATRGGAKLGDVFTLNSEVLTLALRDGWGLQKVDNELSLLKQDAIAPVASADATDLGSAITLVNEIKDVVDLIVSYLKLAEIISDYTGYFHETYFADGYFADGYFKHVA